MTGRVDDLYKEVWTCRSPEHSEGPNRLRRMYEGGTKDVCTKEVFHYIQKWVPIFFVDLVAIRAQVTGIIKFCIYKRIDQLVLVGKKM